MKCTGADKGSSAGAGLGAGAVCSVQCAVCSVQCAVCFLPQVKIKQFK